MRKTLEKPVSSLSWRLLRLPPDTGGQTVFVQGPNKVGQIELVKWDLPEPDDWRPKRPGDPGIGVLSFPVPGDRIDALYQRLTAMGFECYSAPVTTTVVNYGPVTLFVCEDPDGNQVELMSLPTAEQVREHRAAAGVNPKTGTR
jgi:catechol 2,3-dioxygenase-like lactoylglutathione lyase family enzyme